MTLARKYFYPIIAIVLVIVAFVAWQQVLARHDGTLAVSFLDVGQGDATFIEFPGRFQILIDGGPDATVLARLSEVMPPHDRSLDMIVLTHPDADHVAGLVDVLKSYHVARIMETGARKDTDISRAWDAAVKVEGAEHIVVDQSLRFAIGDKGEFLVVWPQESHDGEVMEKPNNAAIVALLQYGETSFLFPADIEANIESQLVMQGRDLDTDVLKVAHHGSKTSSFPNFLAAVSPRIAVISVGEYNRYGHPTMRALDRLAAVVPQIFRTDQNGTVTIESDGKALHLDTER